MDGVQAVLVRERPRLDIASWSVAKLLEAMAIPEGLRQFGPRFERGSMTLLDRGRFHELKPEAFVAVKDGCLIVCRDEAEFRARYTSEPG